ncbi:MAG TPA: TetR/AcrR family transcriptional regulator [Acidimicrobiia bacterium]|nr:TetR/AcrR family transcriptional regulator [Acidimicrobiia bacterium]
MPTLPVTRKARATYGNLITAAREAVRRTGILSSETVAEMAGFSPATLYSYFGSKDSLLAAAFDAALADIAAAVGPILSMERLLEQGWEPTARALVRAVVKGFSHDGRLVRLALTRLGESEEILTVYRRRNQEEIDLFTRFIRLGMAASQLRKGDPAVLARTVVLMLQALQNPLALGPGSGPVIDEVSRALCRLLAPD